MHCKEVAGCILALALASCGTKAPPADAERQLEPIPAAPDEAIGIVKVSSTTRDSLFECVEHALHSEAPDLNFIPSDELRESMFPWFEPGTAPKTIRELAELLSIAAVARRKQEIGLRYVIAVSGTTDSSIDTWGGCAGAYAGAACVGGLSLDERTDLAATILDAQHLRFMGELAASGSGASHAGMILIVPYITLNSSESSTCGDLARRIVEVLNGGPGSSEKTRELLILPAAPG